MKQREDTLLPPVAMGRVGADAEAGPVAAAVAVEVRTNTSAARSQAGAPPGPLENGLRYLSAEELAAWDALVDSSPQGSIFCRSWWLGAVGGDIRVLGHFESGRLVAGIPIAVEQRMGIRLCGMPKLTQTWGVLMENQLWKKSSAARESQILEEFATRLARGPAFVQCFHPASTNWLPFFWNGFSQTTRYTCILEELDSPERLWQGLDENRRRSIRKAEKRGLTVRPCGPRTVYEASVKTFLRQSKRNPYHLDYLTRLYNAASENHAGACFAAEDRQGRVHAAAFFVWDSRRGYYLTGGADPALRESGAGSLLMWRMIEFAAERTSVFDFEGSMVKPIEEFFLSFGSKLQPYNQISRLPKWLRTCLCLGGRPIGS